MRFVFPREVLLVEFERWCREPTCGARARLSLTKRQARSYTGFECERCGRWYWDTLSPRDIPEWWEELKGTPPELSEPAPEALKPAPERLKPAPGGAAERPVEKQAGKADGRPARKVSKRPVVRDLKKDEEEVGEVVARLSRAWRDVGGDPEPEPEVAEAERGDSF